jgi:outer membrane protein
MTLLRIRSAVLLSAFSVALLGGVLTPRVMAAASSLPQDPPVNPPAGQHVTVMVVDIQKLLQDSKAARMVRSQIEQKRLQYAREISRQEQALRAERDALQREQATLSPQVLNERDREFQEKINDLDRSVESKRQALEKSNGEALAKIQRVMLQIIANIAKTRKANLVLPRSDIVLFDKRFEVTDEVLKQLDQQLPSLTVKFATPVPVAANPVPRARAAAVKARRR